MEWKTPDPIDPSPKGGRIARVPLAARVPRRQRPFRRNAERHHEFVVFLLLISQGLRGGCIDVSGEEFSGMNGVGPRNKTWGQVWTESGWDLVVESLMQL